MAKRRAGPSAPLEAGAVHRVLIVEDDPDLASGLDQALQRHGFKTERVATRAAALDRADAADLILLDLSLPDGDGLDICPRLAAQAAVVVISGRDDVADRVAALELGADDYLTKPFGSRELVARCRSVLRSTQPKRGSVVRAGDLQIDLDRHEVHRHGQPLELTTKELGLLVALARQPGDLVRREELAEAVWGTDLRPVNRFIDAHMSSLRQKLGDPSRQPRYIQTVHGLGFRLLP